MRFFITGATGFIGGHLVRKLVAEGHDVVALVRDPERAIGLEGPGVEVVRGDVLDPGSLRAPLAGADGAFHLAAWYRVGVQDASLAEDINVLGTRNVLEAAGEAGVKKIVYTSTIAVFGDTRGRVVQASHRYDGPWLSEYDRTKWIAHFEVAVPMAAAGLPLVIVQPGYVYGPGDHSNVGDVLRDYLRRRLPVKPVQGGCWAHVDDIAHGHLLAMERGSIGESYVMGGECRLWTDVLDLAHAITGVRPPRITLPPILARLSATLMRPLAAVVPLPQMYHPETLRIAAGVTYWADDTGTRRALGWRPRPLAEGLAATLAAERATLS
jgi:nucleoside-diphosphate-sugar epimerase